MRAAFLYGAGAVGIIWLVAALLAIRDKFPGDQKAPVDVTPSDPSANLERQTVDVSLVLFVPVIIVTIVLLSPVAAAQLAYMLFYWLRFELVGTPMPRAGRPEETKSEPGADLSDFDPLEPR